jgi:hypothetical protein
VGVLSFALPVGAALLAVWFDYRFEKQRPESLPRRILHVGLAFAVLKATAVGAGLLVSQDGPQLQRLAVVFGLLLPGIVYGFLSAMWVMRALADAISVARR